MKVFTGFFLVLAMAFVCSVGLSAAVRKSTPSYPLRDMKVGDRLDIRFKNDRLVLELREVETGNDYVTNLNGLQPYHRYHLKVMRLATSKGFQKLKGKMMSSIVRDSEGDQSFQLQPDVNPVASAITPSPYIPPNPYLTLSCVLASCEFKVSYSSTAYRAIQVNKTIESVRIQRR